MGFERSTRDRYLLGVCGGIAHSVGINSNVARLITVLLGIVVPGVSILAVAVVYALLGYLLPESPEF
ncbi:MAG: PspC domain-containing protein [Rubrobacteraceae bacterium]